MMDRRKFISGIALGFVVAPLAAEAQQAARVYRIGFLHTGAPGESASRLDAFRQRLRELGYVEGRNLAIESRWAEGTYERLREFAIELVGQRVDVIVASSAPSALAAKNATTTIPIVFATASRPEGTLVASLARPGGNVTGLSLFAPEVVPRQFQLLKEVVPKASRVALLSNPDSPYTALLVREVETAGRSLGVRVQLLEVRAADALDGAFSAIAKDRQDALFVLFDPVLVFHRARVVELANKFRLPAIYPQREYVEVGGLMSYGADVRDNYRRAANYVDKILKGAKPADLPVEQPTKFELLINLKTAKALGLAMPQSLLLRADEVIQ